MANNELIDQLNKVLGEGKVVTQACQNEYYRKGFRSGSGSALAVVFPDSLTTFWQVLQACTDAGVIIIMQAAKTGLTEGSTPSGEDYDREVVVVNTLAMNDIVLLNDGKQVLSFPGTTLFSLENALKPLKRAPHSVIGSSGLGATVVGGISNNSGGALIKRGPAYTEMSLFAQITAEGKLALVNHLGIDLGDTPEAMLANLENGHFQKEALSDDGLQASDREYVDRLRDVDAATPARFNADKRRLYEASGCAGKLAVFAVRLDTFPVATDTKTFYIGSNKPEVFTRLRRDVLQNFKNMPDVCEYMHRDIFDISEKYGKDTFLTIHHLGTGALPKMFAMKGRIDARLNKLSFLPTHLTDRVMQALSRLFPRHLPKRLVEYRNEYEHHLMLKVSDECIAEAETYLKAFFESSENEGAFIECTTDEAAKAYLNRFSAAGAAMRYESVHDDKVGEMIALDIALRRNDDNWVEALPEEISSQIEHTLYYGHFMCHVFHQDYILKKDADPKAVKAAMLALLDKRGAKYPAEHNVGHLYKAESDLQDFYRKLDPTNTFNPGIGKMDKYKRNCGCCA